MIKVKDIFDYLCSIAPLDIQESYDNAGFLIGNLDNTVSSVYLSLDATTAVINEATEHGANLIITHHPIIWDSLKSVTTDSIVGKKIQILLKKDISVISMHTNLDKTLVNSILINKLLIDKEIESDHDYIKIGTLHSPMPMSNYLSLCKESLKNSSLRYYDSGKPVYKIACLGGAGGGELYDAYERGCDTYITADIKHSTFLDAMELGMNLIDADHFNTENVVIPELKTLLENQFTDIKFEIAESNIQVVHYA